MLIAGLAGHVQSLSGWTALVALAIFPPLVVTWRWHAPGQSMSESIQKALR